MKRQFSAMWEIIPHTFVYPSFYRNPSGHFEISRPKNLTNYFTSGQATPDGLGHIVSRAVILTPSCYYTVTATPDDINDFIVFCDKYGEKRGSVIPKVSGSPLVVKIICSASGDITVVAQDNIIVTITHRDKITQFTVRVASGDDTYEITEVDGKSIIVVDEPGIVNPFARFARRPHDRDFIFDHTLVNSINGVVIDKDVTSIYREITEDDSNDWTLTDIYDILFFSYKDITDGQENSEGNIIRITLNDGKDIYTEDYPLVDFMCCTVETAVNKNLETFSSYHIDNDSNPIENIEDLMAYQTTDTGNLYGVRAGLFAEMLMTGYCQYTDSDFDDLCRLILYIHKQQEKSDLEVVEMLHTFFRDRNIEPEWWSSPDVLHIVRERDEYGELVPWPEQEYEEQPIYYEKTIASRLFDYITYGPDKEVLQSETVARYIIGYNIPDDQYPYVRYYGTVYQDKVSTGLISAQTIVIVTDNGNDASQRYTYPVVKNLVSNSDAVEYRMHFRFQNDSEMCFVQMVDDSQLKKSDTLYALTPDEINTTGNVRETNALHFAVGFETKDEGCYENSLGMFIMNTENQQDDFFIGLLQFRTEVEDEDERYRTLFTNFGIPDPVIYPNIFKEQDPQEEGIDWRLVNKKSKELFLDYDQIFPHTGTYRALFNAIKYLGYQDIIFKEWYKLKDSNDKTKFVAIQNYDTSGGKSVRNVIKKYGINYEDYDRYIKLNRLLMIYHLQEINDTRPEDRQRQKAYVFIIANQEIGLPEEGIPYRMSYYSAIKNKFSKEWNENNVIIYRAENNRLYLTLTKIDSNGCEVPDDTKYITQESSLTHIVTSTRRSGSGIHAVMPIYSYFNTPSPFVVDDSGRHEYNYSYDEIPSVENIYEYRNEEVLAKLYSVKNWLEDYITGVNCYISDINGEYITLERIKTVGYVTGGEVKDITSEGFFTPHCEINRTLDASTGLYVQDVFTDSSINIQCSLNEFRSVTFMDYADYPIDRFIRWNYGGMDENSPLKVHTTIDGSIVDVPIYVSAPLNALTVADEYQYSLRLENPSSGSLYEFTDEDYLDNPIVIQNGEIKFMDDSKRTSRISNSSSGISSNECPVIQITKGNLRLVSGDWAADSDNNNVEWKITTQQIIEEGHEDAQKYVIMENVVTGESARFKGAMNLSPDGESSEFLYTSENKWQVPMFIITGYVPTNQLRSDYLSGDYIKISTMFREQLKKHYVLDIVEGRIMFHNHHIPGKEKFCKGAEIGFRFTDEKEQEIRVDYTWESERVPIYDFSSDEFVQQVNDTSLTAQSFYDTLDSYVTENVSVNIPVNRIGDYVVSVKAYDAYNNTYTNESDDKCRVCVCEPSMEIIVNQKNASNGIWFYKESPDGLLLNDTEKESIISSVEDEPEYPTEYKVYSALHNVDNHTITYDNITYAIDTPKAEDYLTLTNMTEAAWNVSISGRKATILMKSSNPDKQNIYNPGGCVTLCVYDEMRKQILFESDVLEIDGTPIPPTHLPQTDIITYDGQLTVNNVPSEIVQYVSQINKHDNAVSLYVINSTVREIKDEYIDYIEFDEDKQTTFIPVSTSNYDRAFSNDTMVKLCTTYITDNDGFAGRMNETAFRVIDTENKEIKDEDGNVTVYYGYRLDGIINHKFIKSLKNRDLYIKKVGNNIPEIEHIKITLEPLNVLPVEYVLRINDDAVERATIDSSGDFYTIHTSVQYNPYQLLFDEYIDNTYSLSNSHFDHDMLREMWRDQKTLSEIWSDPSGKDVSIYLYKDQPITVGNDRYLIIRPCSDISTIESGYCLKWRWFSYGIEDKTNWKDNNGNMEKMLLFESTNKVLSVTPNMLGSQSLELYCMDRYGNVISNTRGGNIMVCTEKSTEKIHTFI